MNHSDVKANAPTTTILHWGVTDLVREAVSVYY
jgi:hypothetical protein